MEKPLLSILIPTKNREVYAANVIDYILSINDDRIQLVIYNNSDSNSLETLISSHFNDPRFKYIYNPELLSFVSNFDLGICECDGEYITIIGDDDSINPDIIDVIAWAKDHNIEAITPSLQLIYYWPESGVNAKEDFGRLTVSEISSKINYYNPQKELKKLLKNGCQNYLSFHLVKVYHGVIQKKVVDKIKEKTGKYIGGLSPDIYLSVATSCIVNRVLTVDYPLTISGICKKSGSADSASGKHTGKLEDAPHFRGHTNYKWSEKVPAFYSVETIWADSALAALTDLVENKLMKHFNISVISAHCLQLYPAFKKQIIQNIYANFNSLRYFPVVNLFLLTGYLKGPLVWRLKGIFKHVFFKKSFEVFKEIPTIKDANKLVNEIIGKQTSTLMENLNQR